MFSYGEKVLGILCNRRGNLPNMCIKSIQVVQQRQVMTIDKIADEIQDQMLEIRRNGNRPAYVILDRSTWLMVRGSHNVEEYVQFGHKQKDYESPDKMCGLHVAVLTGYKDEQVIKVVE